MIDYGGVDSSPMMSYKYHCKNVFIFKKSAILLRYYVAKEIVSLPT
eukprot:UN01430